MARSPISRAHASREAGAGRLFNQLLVAALHGAVALAQVDAIAMVVAEHLHLNMLGAAKIFLDVEAVVMEGLAHLALRGGEDVGELFEAPHQPDAASTATSRRLEHQREADARRRLVALADASARYRCPATWAARRASSHHAPAPCRPSAPSRRVAGR